MADYIVTGRPVGQPIEPAGADSVITEQTAIGDTVSADLDEAAVAEYEDAGALIPAPVE